MKRFCEAAAILACQVLATPDTVDSLTMPNQDLYRCNTENFTCDKCIPPGIQGCQFLTPCQGTCGKFVPSDLVGHWRGVMSKNIGTPTDFDQGEQDFYFGKTTLTVTLPDLKKQQYDVSTIQGDTFILTDEKSSSVAFTYGALQNLKYTNVVGISSYLNSTYPISLSDAIKRDTTRSFTLFQCKSWDAAGTCFFSEPAQQMVEEEAPTNVTKTPSLFGRLDKCARCDPASQKCNECDCNTGGDCVFLDTCQADCGSAGQMYSCTWNTTNPQCVADDRGKLDKDGCEDQCHNAQYGKCDFTAEKCIPCTPGTDTECIQTMSVCQAAQEEKQICKKGNLDGVFRMNEVNKGFTVGEYVVSFISGEMHIEHIKKDIKDGLRGRGKVDFGTTTETFGVKDWNAVKIWRSHKMYGAYSAVRGEQGVFNFLELAFTDHPFTDLKEGLQGGLYLVGFNCIDHTICDYSQIPNYQDFSNIGQTPAVKELFFLQ